jgi:Flp pilus assembly protein protease CpaA
MLFLFAPFALAIALIDVKTHRIPNTLLIWTFSMLLLFKITWGDGLSNKNLIVGLSFLLVGMALGAVGDMGGGDVKLLTVLGLLVIAPSRDGVSRFFVALIAALSIHMLIFLLRHRTLQGHLPLAPSILTGAIWSAC